MAAIIKYLAALRNLSFSHSLYPWLYLAPGWPAIAASSTWYTSFFLSFSTPSYPDTNLISLCTIASPNLAAFVQYFSALPKSLSLICFTPIRNTYVKGQRGEWSMCPVRPSLCPRWRLLWDRWLRDGNDAVGAVTVEAMGLLCVCNCCRRAAAAAALFVVFWA